MRLLNFKHLIIGFLVSVSISYGFSNQVTRIDDLKHILWITDSKVSNEVTLELSKYVDKVNNDWVNDFNSEVGKINKYYLNRALFFPENGDYLQGKEEIVTYYQKNYHRYEKFRSIQTLGRYKVSKDCLYEIGYLENNRNKIFIYLVIWKESGDGWQKELECISKKDTDKCYFNELNMARKRWVEICKEHDPPKLVSNLYTNNATYYNNMIVHNGQEGLTMAFKFLLNLCFEMSPKIVVCVKHDLAYEICEWSGSIGKGDCIYLWSKQDGDWKIRLDSNY